MHIEQLDLIAYGPFSGTRLDFSSTGLHLVYGPNEAGKSSALSALLDFLFGFPNRSLATFKHGSKQVRVGATVRSQEQRFSLVRRKGRKDTLLTQAGDPVEESLLQDVLGGVERQRFELEFGINYAQLVSGGRDLAAGKGDLANALFAAASGTDRWSNVKKQLENQAKELFLSRGTVPVINNLAEQIAEAKKTLAECQLRPAQWDESRSKLQQQQDRLQQAEQRLRLSRDRLRQVEYRERLQPLLQHYRQFRDVFVASGILKLPADDLFERWESHVERLEAQLALWLENQKRDAQLRATVASTDSNLGTESTLELDWLLENRESFITSFRQALRYYQSQHQLQRKKEAAEQTLQEQFSELTAASPTSSEPSAEEGGQQQFLWTEEKAWYLSELEADLRRQFDQLLEEYQKLQHRRKEILQAREPLAQRLENIEELPQLSQESQASFQDRQHWLRENRELPAWLRLEQEWQQEVDQLRAKVDQLLQSVPEFRDSDWDSPLEFEKLNVEKVLQDAAQLQALQREVAERERQRETLTNERSKLQQSDDDLGDCSDEVYRRWSQWEKELWVELKRHLGTADDSEADTWWGQFIHDLPEDSPAAFCSGSTGRWRLVEVFEATAQRVREIQDLRLENARRVLLARQQEAQQRQLEEQLAAVEQALAQQKADLQVRETAWRQLLDSFKLKVVPLRAEPVLKEWERAFQWEKQRLALESRRSVEQERWSNALEQLHEWVAAVDGAEQLSSRPIDWYQRGLEIQDQAVNTLEQAKARQTQEKELLQKFQWLEQQLQECDVQQKELDRRRNERLQSGELPTALVWFQLEKWLQELDEYQESLRDWEKHHAAMQAAAQQCRPFQANYKLYFDSATMPGQQLLSRIGNRTARPSVQQDWGSEVDAAIQELTGQLNQAKVEQRESQRQKLQREEFVRQLAQLESELAKQQQTLDSELASMEGEIAGYLTSQASQRIATTGADATSMNAKPLAERRLEELKLFLQRVEQGRDDAKHLDSRLEGIAKLGGANLLVNATRQPRDQAAELGLEAATDSSSEENRQAELEELSRRVEEQEREVKELRQIWAVQKNELDRLERSTEAVELRQKIEDDLAQLEQECDRYLDCALASVLIDEAMTRYSQQNQHPILQLARTFFRQLTLESFADIQTETDVNGKKFLVGIRRDQSVVPVSGMSEGTESQLFLSLRLAALQHYLNHHPALPFVVDDILKDYDDRRALAALQAFADVGASTQVIVFTHHEHLLQLVEQHLPAAAYQIHRLQSGHSQTIAT